MATGFVAVGAVAVAFYVYRKSRKQFEEGASIVETHRGFEHAPTNWTGEILLFAEALRYIYVETLGKWPTGDLFIGIVYLARQGLRHFPAKEVVSQGNRIFLERLGRQDAYLLHKELVRLRRLLLYSQNLKFSTGPVILEGTWADVGLKKNDFLIYKPKAAVLKPAYVLVKDVELKSLVLAVRGTHTVKDIFTSLSGAGKPHHMVDSCGVVLGHSHFGMLAAARWLFKDVLSTLETALHENPDYGLTLTGHSMGGGTAAILTMMIREQLSEIRDIQCATFACPGCVTLEIAQSCSSYITTVVYGTDAVPALSPAAVDLLREEVAQSSWGHAFRHDVRSSDLVQAVEARFRGLAKSMTSLASSSLRGCYGGQKSFPNLGKRDSSRTESCAEFDCLDLNSGHGPVTSGEKAEGSSTSVLEMSTTIKYSSDPDLQFAENIESCSKIEAQGSSSVWTQSSLGKKLLNFGTSIQQKGQPGALAISQWGRQTGESLSQGVENIFAKTWFTKKKQIKSGDSLKASNSSPQGETPEITEALQDEEVEGVFDGRSAQEESCEPREEMGTVPQELLKKRQLYPAGKVYHIVPAFILRAEETFDEASTDNQDDEDCRSEVAGDWYHPVQGSSPISEFGDRDDNTYDDEYVMFSNVPQKAYNRIRMSRSMVVDHFVPSYRSGIESLIESLQVTYDL